ncbi:MAG: ABC transporter ATP-binding protein [Campylobacteraceae bacterium]|nr:ABC transporter ATP-binding protein [Campylobacteraceae bacterium]
MQNKTSVFYIIKKYGKSKSKYLIPCLALQILATLTSLVPIFCLWRIICSLFFSYPEFDANLVSSYLLWAVVLQIFSTFCAFFASILAHIMAFEVENGLREASFSHLLNLPLGYFEVRESGRLRKIIDDNAGLTHTFIAHQFPDMIPGVLVPLVVLTSMFVVDFCFGLVLIFCLLLALLALKSSFSSSNSLKMEKYQHALENINTEGVEYFRGIPVVKVFQQSVLSFNRFYKVIKDYEKYCLDYTVNFRNPYILMNIALYLPYMLIGILCICLIPSSENPLELITDAIFYILITIVFNANLMRLLKLSSGVGSLNIAMKKINEILDTKALDIEKISDKKNLQTPIFIDNISFSYDGKREILKSITYTFEKGKSYALVGKSGSGKSTLVNLIGRFFDVGSGNIYIDGQNIKTMSESEIFAKISVVSQKQRLIKETIFENVRMYDESKNENHVKTALKNANALEIVDALSEGIQTRYGSKGTHFSGGEIQRIALARAFLKDTPILLLDEAMAFVDADNEKEILEAINRLKANKTTIMILHRLNSASSFDEIIMMDNGKIIGSGHHDVLVKECMEYRDLYEEYQKTIKWRVKNA